MSAYSRLKAMREGAVKMIDVRHALASRFIRDRLLFKNFKIRQGEEPLGKFNFSFSPGFSPGTRAGLESWNRFNGFRKIPVILEKPLKRLTIFPSRP